MPGLKKYLFVCLLFLVSFANAQEKSGGGRLRLLMDFGWRFFYKSIGREQTIYINGKEIGKNLKENADGYAFQLDASTQKPGKNQILTL